jgi:hypothetical protein
MDTKLFEFEANGYKGFVMEQCPVDRSNEMQATMTQLIIVELMGTCDGADPDVPGTTTKALCDEAATTAGAFTSNGNLVRTSYCGDGQSDCRQSDRTNDRHQVAGVGPGAQVVFIEHSNIDLDSAGTSTSAHCHTSEEHEAFFITTVLNLKADGLNDQCSSDAGNSDQICELCPAGKNSDGNGPCADCAAGKFSAAAATICTDCAAGKASSAGGATTCTDCEAGKYSDAGGATACTDCTTDTFAANAAATVCTAVTVISCPSDQGLTAATASADATCAPCTAGKFSGAGADTCADCAVGKYQLATAELWPGSKTACTLCCVETCPAGEQFKTVADAEDCCEACPPHTFSTTAGTTACTAYTTAADCDAGYGFTAGTATSDTSCTVCGASEWSPGGGEVCQNHPDCPKGQVHATAGDITQVRKTLAQKLGQLQPFLAVFPLECMGQLASFGPT